MQPFFFPLVETRWNAIFYIYREKKYSRILFPHRYLRSLFPHRKRVDMLLDNHRAAKELSLLFPPSKPSSGSVFVTGKKIVQQKLIYRRGADAYCCVLPAFSLRQPPGISNQPQSRRGTVLLSICFQRFDLSFLFSIKSSFLGLR